MRKGDFSLCWEMLLVFWELRALLFDGVIVTVIWKGENVFSKGKGKRWFSMVFEVVLLWWR